MWCGFGKSSASIAVVCLMAASVAIADSAMAVRQRNYTPRQFRALLHGLGYNIQVSDAPLTAADAKKAIQEFQKGYKIQPADGVAGPKTQDFAANIVEILQANLNLVLKPATPLPKNQYYGPQTEAAVRQYQKKVGLKETGIADLALRQRLDKEAKEILKQPAPTPTSTPTPTASPTPRTTTTPKKSPTPRTTTTPKTSPTPTSTATPTKTP